MKHLAVCIVFVLFYSCNPVQNEQEASHTSNQLDNKTPETIRFSIDLGMWDYVKYKKSFHKINVLSALFPLNPFNFKENFFPSTDIYLILNVKGFGRYIIPDKIENSSDRRALLSFIGSKGWANQDFLLEIWSINEKSNLLDKAILRSIKFNISGKEIGVPIPLSASVEIPESVIKDFYDNNFIVCVLDGKLPKVGSKYVEKFYPLSEHSYVFGSEAYFNRKNELNASMKVFNFKMCEITIENHGK